MARDVHSFTLHDSLLDGIDDMSPDECKAFLTAIRDYRRGNEPQPQPDRFMRLKVANAISLMREADERYRIKCETLANNRRGKTAAPKPAQDVAPPTEQPPLAAPTKPAKTNQVPDEVIESIRLLWNDVCGPTFGSLQSITVKRRQKIETRVSEFPRGSDVIQQFQAIFDRILASDFCRKGARKWCNFDWLITNDTNYTKVLEGRYDNDNQTNNNGQTITTRFDRQQLAEQQLASALAQQCADQMQREADIARSDEPSIPLFAEVP